MSHPLRSALLIATAFGVEPASAAEFPIVEVQIDAIVIDDVVTYSLAEKANDESNKPRIPAKRIMVHSFDDEDQDEDVDTKDAKTPLEIARDLGISSDDVRPDQQLETSLFGKRLIIGGEISVTAIGRRHYDLEIGADDDDIEFAPEATLETIWLPSDTSAVFASVEAFAQSELYNEGGGAQTRAGVSLQNLWLLQTQLLGTPLAVQIGRQRMQDRREWWWDESLDAVRLHYLGSDVKGFIGIGQRNAVYLSTLGRNDPEERGLLRLFGNLDWKWKNKHHVEFFAMYQNDRTARYRIGQIVERDDVDDRDAKLTWLGLRARGCIKSKFPRRICYWGEIARVSGRKVQYDLDRFDAGDRPASRIVDRAERRKVRGWAYDVGASFQLPFDFKPYLTVGHARGSGDRPGTPGRDGAFRQTGLHKNDGKFRGNSRFRYYGEVLRPNLSNIAISTVAIGIPVKKHGWLEAVWHYYRQPHADNRISGSRLGKNPNGDNNKLGEEIDLIMSHRPKSGWEFQLIAGALRSGPAFGNDAGRWAKMIEFKLDYNF